MFTTDFICSKIHETKVNFPPLRGVLKLTQKRDGILNGTAIDCKYSTATHYVLRVGADAFTISHKHVHCRITWTVINGTVSRIEVAMSRIRSEKQYKAPEEGKRDQLLRHDRNCS